jgi:hypothetical protein
MLFMHVYPFYQSMDVIRYTKKTYYGGDSFKTACKLYMNKDGPKDATLRFVSEFFSIKKHNRARPY